MAGWWRIRQRRPLRQAWGSNCCRCCRLFAVSHLTGACAEHTSVAGANTTLWNVVSSGGNQIPLPTCDFGPLLDFVGNYGAPGTTETTAAGAAYDFQLMPDWCPAVQWYVELLRPGAKLYPRNLHIAMVEHRAARRQGTAVRT